ncbi:MAG: hypothetical protein U5L46_12800 [Agrobacterium sp.]|nr:hypothetical protein [Agrobacterium sp.]
MDHLLQAVKKSVESRNWEAALLVAINLPDVCAKLEGIESQKKPKVSRYVIWAKKWLEPNYTREMPVRIPPAPKQVPFNLNSDEWKEYERLNYLRRQFLGKTEPHVFISAEDLYALRCAFTHAAHHDLSEQRIGQSLSSFEIRAPVGDSFIHLNKSFSKGPNGENISTVQIQVDVFCHEICDAVECWRIQNDGNAALQEAINRMPRIVPFY